MSKQHNFIVTLLKGNKSIDSKSPSRFILMITKDGKNNKDRSVR